jgi:hypothetical protein
LVLKRAVGAKKGKKSMHDEHRKYEHCIFCTGTDLTAEHIFGKALARRIGLKENWTATQLQRDGSVISAKGGSPILSITAELLCKDCNNKDLSDEMRAAVDVVHRMAEGETFELTEAQVSAVRRYAERVALIVDVITSDHHMTDSQRSGKDFKRSAAYRTRPPVYSDEERIRWRAGEVLDGLEVFVGYHDGVLGVNPYVNVAHGFGMRGPGRLLSPWKRLVFIIKGLAVYVSIGSAPALIREESWALLRNGKPSLKWPISPAAGYLDIVHLAYPTPDLQLIASYLSIPDVRTRIEEHSRSVGRFEAPPGLDEFVDEYLAKHEQGRDTSPPATASDEPLAEK